MTSSTAPTSIVIDSNVWISALVFGGDPRKVFEAVLERGDSIVMSPELVSEIRRTLARKFPDAQADFEALLGAFHQSIVMVALGVITVTVCRDPDDNKVLETAIIGKARSIISGDNDLLVLGSYNGVHIRRPAAWLQGI